jgi:carbamoyl-phosphate synthase large subunit
MKILVTGVGGAAGRSMAIYLESNGVQFIVADMNPDAGSKYTGKFFQIPAASDPTFVQSLLEIIKREKVDILIPTVDEEFVPIASSRELFERNGVKLPISSLETIRICRDKYATATTLEKNGIRVPKTFIVSARIDKLTLGFPLIVKPRSGRGGKGIKVFNSMAELKKDIKNYDDSYIIQEFIGGQEYDSNIFVRDGKVLVNKTLLKAELEFGNYGNAVKTVPIRDEAVERIAHDTAIALHAEGALDMDIRKTGDGTLCVLEVNPRFGANALKTPEVLYELLKWLGITPKPFSTA